MRQILCRLGIHRPLKLIKFKYVDPSTGELVFISKCPCGQHWLNAGYKWFGFKIRTLEKVKFNG
jgi:hypothetical protein